ncbi:MAG: PLDc N-terminal domain-containing protein [Candidatus Nanopelagicales bacterium]
MAKRTWRELGPQQRTTIIVAGAAEVVLTTIALLDVVRRPRAEVRGPKALWILSFAVQPFGTLAYLTFGRRPGRPGPPTRITPRG